MVSHERCALLEQWFPDLRAWGYQRTSEFTFDYNCIAWAAGESSRNWWPTPAVDGVLRGYWPEGAPREETMDAFVKAFECIGYALCDDESYDAGYEKIALYADHSGKPTHAARQIDREQWTSKMGPYEDISHPLRAIEGDEYGRAVRFMRRPRLA